MPFARNQGIRIHYQTVGGGPALVLHHGTFGSGADWADLGYVDALKDDHQLVLIDSRGHGESDKPHDPTAYDLALRASDVLAVLDDLGIRKADYFGYSLGGWIGFELARSAPDRFNSFIFGCAHPYAEDMQAFRNLMPRDPDSFARVIDQLSKGGMPPAMRSRWLANDLEASRALTQDRASNAAALPSMTMPCLVFVGEDDPRLPKVKECASALPSAAFFSLPGCDHLAAFARSDLVLPHAKAFLSKAGLSSTADGGPIRLSRAF
jgi:pimeloyl-ACP methyl ester carboxylesterase